MLLLLTKHFPCFPIGNLPTRPEFLSAKALLQKRLPVIGARELDFTDSLRALILKSVVTSVCDVVERLIASRVGLVSGGEYLFPSYFSFQLFLSASAVGGYFRQLVELHIVLGLAVVAVLDE